MNKMKEITGDKKKVEPVIFTDSNENHINLCDSDISCRKNFIKENLGICFNKDEIKTCIIAAPNSKTLRRELDPNRVSLIKQAFINAFKIPNNKLKTEWQWAKVRINRIFYDSTKGLSKDLTESQKNKQNEELEELRKLRENKFKRNEQIL